MKHYFIKQSLKKKLLIPVFAVMLLSVTTCGDMITDALDDSNYVYYIQAVNGVPLSGEESTIDTYRIQDNGDIKITQSISAPTSTNNIVVNPSGTKAYLLSTDLNSIPCYDIKPGGEVKFSIFNESYTQNWDLSIDKNERFAYSSHFQPLGRIIAYSIGSKGALTSIQSTILGAVNIRDLLIHPSGKYLYCSRFILPTPAAQAGEGLWKYTINSDGTLSGGVQQGADFDSPWDMVISRSGEYLYHIESNGFIRAYSINAIDGSLILIGAPINCGATLGLAFDRNENFLFVSIYTGSIISYRINKTDGSLTAVGSTPTDAGSCPRTLVSHPTRDFLYSQQVGKIVSYRIMNDGMLEKISDTPNNQVTTGGRIIINRNYKY